MFTQFTLCDPTAPVGSLSRCGGIGMTIVRRPSMNATAHERERYPLNRSATRSLCSSNSLGTTPPSDSKNFSCAASSVFHCS